MKGRAKLLDPCRDNLYRRELDQTTGELVLEKSCPKCSKKAGVTVYYRESEFRKGHDGGTESLRDCQRHRKASPSPALL